MTRPSVTGWCEVMEMDAAGCAHCRMSAGEVRRRERELAGHQGAAPDREVAVDSTFEWGPVVNARYGSQCRGCRGAILAGESIRLAGGGWVHEGCEP